MSARDPIQEIKNFITNNFREIEECPRPNINGYTHALEFYYKGINYRILFRQDLTRLPRVRPLKACGACGDEFRAKPQNRYCRECLEAKHKLLLYNKISEKMMRGKINKYNQLIALTALQYRIKTNQKTNGNNQHNS